MKRTAAAVVAGAVVVGGGARSYADSVSLAFVNGTTNFTTEISTFQTSGSMMDGMKFTARFGDGSSQQAIWADDPMTGADAGHAVGTNWQVRENGDTFGGEWHLENRTGKVLTSLEIDAGPGGTVFDTDFGGMEGTPGSSAGLNFSIFDTMTGLSLLATYTDRVALTGQSPVGDLWRFLRIDFQNTGGLASGAAITFVQDTDTLKFGDLVVPLPSGAGMAAACAALAGLRRRR